MKILLFFMLTIMIKAGFAQTNQTFEDRINAVNPSFNISFENPMFAGLRLLGRSGDDLYSAGWDMRFLTYNATTYCRLLGYSSVLFVSEEPVEPEEINEVLTVEHVSFVPVSVDSLTIRAGSLLGSRPNENIYPTVIKRLRCRK